MPDLKDFFFLIILTKYHLGPPLFTSESIFKYSLVGRLLFDSLSIKGKGNRRERGQKEKVECAGWKGVYKSASSSSGSAEAAASANSCW